jgi:hypothetical protein
MYPKLNDVARVRLGALAPQLLAPGSVLPPVEIWLFIGKAGASVCHEAAPLPLRVLTPSHAALPRSGTAKQKRENAIHTNEMVYCIAS